MMRDEIKNTIDIAFTALVNGHPEISEDLLRSKKSQSDLRVLFDLGYHEWRHGRLKEGLSLMDAGRVIRVFGAPPLPNLPTADRLPSLDGATVILRLEGGFGDEMFGVRFARDLTAMGAKVVAACSPAILPLVSRVDGVAFAVGTPAVEAGLVHADAWVPGMSVGRLIGLDPEKVRNAKYLRADPAHVEKWAGVVKGDFKAGLRWRGNPKFEHEQFRTFDPATLFRIADIPGVACYSLQRDTGAEMLPKASKVIDLGPHLETWEDTAGVISNLDLVVTSCTAVAHLAAAMGKPTWVIVPIMPYYVWAWPWGSETSPWYPRVRLFRQEKFGEWSAPLERAVAEVGNLVSQVVS